MCFRVKTLTFGPSSFGARDGTDDNLQPEALLKTGEGLPQPEIEPGLRGSMKYSLLRRIGLVALRIGTADGRESRGLVSSHNCKSSVVIFNTGSGDIVKSLRSGNDDNWITRHRAGFTRLK